MSFDLKLLDIDHPLTFEERKVRQIEAHALIYLVCIYMGVKDHYQHLGQVPFEKILK